jgi:hypothetical protein
LRTDEKGRSVRNYKFTTCVSSFKSIDEFGPLLRQEALGAPGRWQTLGYFVRNVSRMQYGTFRAAGWFIGSGVVEAGC